MKLLAVFNSDPLRAPFAFRQMDPVHPQHSGGMRSLTGLILSLIHCLHQSRVTDVKLVVNPLEIPSQTLPLVQDVLDRCPFEAELLGAEDPGCVLETMTNPYSWAKGQRTDHLLFVEADCLFPRHGVEQLVANFLHFRQLHNKDLIMSPIDQAELYAHGVASHLLAGATSFWRTIPATRRTLLMSPATLELCGLTFVADFTQRLWSPAGDDQWTIPLSSPGVPCLSPMPGLGVSLLAETPSPFVKPESWYNAHDLDAGSCPPLRVPVLGYKI